MTAMPQPTSQFETKTFEQRRFGVFYTHEAIGRRMARLAADSLPNEGCVHVCDPFCGDGRLLVWFLEEVAKTTELEVELKIHAWDINANSVAAAEGGLTHQIERMENVVELSCLKVDTFQHALNNLDTMDFVITNPPWEAIKPDYRELKAYDDDQKEKIISELKFFDSFLAENYPVSQPSRKFAGWGTNLSRVGTELSVRLLKSDGLCFIVLPTSLLGDMTSGALRKWLFDKCSISDVCFYPSEERLFKGADQDAIALKMTMGGEWNSIQFIDFREGEHHKGDTVNITREGLQGFGDIIPARLGSSPFEILPMFRNLPRLDEWEGDKCGSLWGGREVDETRIEAKFISGNGTRFLRSRDMERFTLRKEVDELPMLPSSILPSVSHKRIIWRDISRPSMKRRVNAAICPKGIVCGNSVGVFHFLSDDEVVLHGALGIVNSLVFEYQFRALLSTNHITWGVLRNIHTPPLSQILASDMPDLVASRIKEGNGIEPKIEALAARLYGIDSDHMGVVLDAFPKIKQTERDAILNELRG